MVWALIDMIMDVIFLFGWSTVHICHDVLRLNSTSMHSASTLKDAVIKKTGFRVTIIFTIFNELL